MATEVTVSPAEISEEKVVAGDEDDVVDPWNVVSKSQTGVDYDKLISKLLVDFYPERTRRIN